MVHLRKISPQLNWFSFFLFLFWIFNIILYLNTVIELCFKNSFLRSIYINVAKSNESLFFWFYHVYKRKKNLLSTSRLWPVRRLLLQTTLFTTQSIQGRIYRLFWIKAVRILLRCQVWRAFAPPGFSNSQQKSLLL